MNKIDFNISLIETVNMNLFIKSIKEVNKLVDSLVFLYEYTIDLEKITYAEQRFTKFSLFEKFYKSNDYRFDLLKFEDNKTDLFIGFQQTRGRLRIFGRIMQKELFFNLISIFEKYILFAYCHNDIDITLSRVDTYRSWIRKMGTIPPYINLLPNRESTGEMDKYLIDLNSVPTHSHLMLSGDKLWFGACAIMYFSDLYYKYIPIEKWANFSNCEENIVLESHLRKIILYNDLSDFENPINRNKQWDFRKQLGIDEVICRLF